MPDFIFSTLPDEAQTPETYANLSATPGERAAGAFFHEPTTTLARKAEEAAYDPDAELFRAFIAGAAPEAGLATSDLRAPPSPIMSPEEANKLSPDGSPLTDKPIPQDLAHVLATHRAQKIEADSAIQRFDKQHWWPTNVGLDLAVGMADPLNLSTMLLPGLGEESVAARLGLSGFAGRAAARGIAGATAGPIMQAPISALRLGVDDDYGLRDAMYDLAFQAPLSAAIGATAIGLPAEAVHWLRGMPATTRHAQMSAATAQLVEGKPLDVDFAPMPPETMTAIGQFMGHPFLEPRLRTPEPIEAEGGRILRFLEPQRGRTAADLNALTAFAERQKALAETGYAPGMPQENLVAATQAVRQAAETPVEVPTSTFDRAMTGDEKVPEGWATPVMPEATTPALPSVETPATAPLDLPRSIVAPPAEREMVPIGGPEYARESIERNWAIAQRLGVIDDIERLAAEGTTANEVAVELGSRLDPIRRVALANGESERSAAAQFVRNVRSGLGIPSLDQASEYAEWLINYRSRAGGVEGAGEAGAGPSGGGIGGGRGAQPEAKRSTLTELTDQGEQIVMPGMERSAQPGGMFAPREEGTPEFPELVAAERQLASIDQADLLPEERGILMATEAEVRAADEKEGLYRETANCMKDHDA